MMIRHPKWNLFKLHGSVDWYRIPSVRLRDTTAEEVCAWADRVPLQDGIYTARQLDSDPGIARVPAIAVPVSDKLEFECPLDHKNHLISQLPKIDRILTIGWKGAEAKFLDLLKTHLKQKVTTVSVDISTDLARSTAKALVKAGVNVQRSGYHHQGFSMFIRRNLSHAFSEEGTVADSRLGED